MSWAQRGGVINPPVICWPQFCCCRRFCWRDRWSLNRAVKWLSVSPPGPSGASPGGGVQSQNQAALGCLLVFSFKDWGTVLSKTLFV